MPSTRGMHAANQTGHEAQYLRSLVDRQIKVQIKLRDGEQVQGVIEYFDANILRLMRDGQPNLFLYKHHVQTISEGPRRKVQGNTAARTA
jgi:host factor-I protein